MRWVAVFTPFQVDKARNVIDYGCASRGVGGIRVFENLADGMKNVNEPLWRHPFDQVEEGAVRYRIEHLAARGLQFLVVDNFRDRRVKQLEHSLDGYAQGRIVVSSQKKRSKVSWHCE
jgi:hypothetical protein